MVWLAKPLHAHCPSPGPDDESGPSGQGISLCQDMEVAEATVGRKGGKLAFITDLRRPLVSGWRLHYPLKMCNSSR